MCLSMSTLPHLCVACRLAYTQLNAAQPSSTQLNPAQPSSTQLNAAQRLSTHRDTSSQLERVPLRAARPPRPHQLRPLRGLHEHRVLRAQNPRRIRWHDRHAVAVDVAQQRVDVALHDPHARLLEDGPGVGPAALPEQPQPVFARVLQAPGLRRLRHALPDVLAADVPAPAGRERRERQRRAAVAAPAAAVEVGDGREGGSGGHLGFCCSGPIYRASRQREVTTFGSVEVIGKRTKEIDGRADTG